MADRVVSEVEWIFLKTLSAKNRFPPLFVVGAPRCGTTIPLLHLVNTFEFSYFPNISKRNPQHPLIAATLGALIWDYTPTTESNYGVVKGPMAPSDGWQIFHRWFPRYDHSEQVDTESLSDLRRMVAFLEFLMGGPFLNKNNNNSTRIQELSQLFPRSLFVHIRRNPRDAVASLIRAREEKGVSPDEWWGVAPPHRHDTAPTGTVERSVLQVCEVDDHIRNSLQEISEYRRFGVWYKSFCEKPERLERWVEDKYDDFGSDFVRHANKPTRTAYTPSSSWKSLSISTRNQVEKLLSIHCR
ncbi:sulfotransferase [Salinibacter altiplanensis]|uniref:sulfotransferase n=1 Tax=Salinibacter altiplanensis TaxID=1803181 RepID=UPI00131A1616|nr:sulfotransferase [Salinibacter altiplanensis]